MAPCEVAYEDLVSEGGYERTFLAVLEHIGVDTSGVVVPPPRTDRQADELNEAWVARYLAERERAASS